MEDKILIKSKMDKKVKNFLEKGAIACLIIAALMALLLTLQYDASYYDGYVSYKTTIPGWRCLFCPDFLVSLLLFAFAGCFL